VTDDATRLAVAHAPPAGDRGLGAVVAHGFTGSLTDAGYRRVVTWLTDAGVGVVGLDFRGHGGSAGLTTVGDREVLDVEAALTWLRQLGYRRYATIGFSMGGAVVVRHAAMVGGVGGVVSVSAPGRWYYRGTPSMRRAHFVVEHPVGRWVARTLRNTRVAPDGWDPLPLSPREAAAQVAVPLLVVHGDVDAYFPLDHAEDLARGGSATLWVEPGFGHAENAASAELVGRIAAWARENVEEPE
jgi:pimeloyl-ACP methyl ester carboxylesterase